MPPNMDRINEFNNLVDELKQPPSSELGKGGLGAWGLFKLFIEALVK